MEISNEELVQKIQGGEVELITELWNKNINLIKSILNKYSTLAEFDDLLQESYIAFDRAVKMYEPERAAFSSVLVKYVKYAIIRYLNQNNSVSINSIAKAKITAFKKARQDLYKEHGKEPNIEQISAYMGITTNQAIKLEMYAYSTDLAYLDAPIKEQEGLNLGDTVPDGTNLENDVISKIDDEELAKDIWEEVDKLGEQEATIIRRYYADNKSYPIIAEELNLDTKRVSNISQKAKSKLRFKLQRKKSVKAYLEEQRILSRAFRRSGFRITHTSITEELALELLELENKYKA